MYNKQRKHTTYVRQHKLDSIINKTKQNSHAEIFKISYA